MISVRRGGLPTSAVRELGGVFRRTRALRLALVAAIGAVAAAVLLASGRLGATPTSYFASGAGGIVVLDLSTSVEPRKYQRIHRVLRSLSETSTRVGLVVFSDVAYEMLPPGTRGEELAPLLSFFQLPKARFVTVSPGRFGRRNRRFLPPPEFDPTSPWTSTFRGGTRISTGLAVARQAIERDGGQPTVMLVSDLDDSTLDTEALTQELIRYEAAGIDLRVVPLFAFPDDRALFVQLVGKDAFVQNDELLRNSEIEERQALVGSFPVPLALAVAGLLALLALNEHVCARVGWRRA